MARTRIEVNVKLLAMLPLSIILFAQLAGTDVQADAEALRQNEQSQASDGATVAKQVARTDVYGDPLPPGALARLGTIRLRHDHNYGYLATALSPDGKTLATGGSRSLRLWSLADGKLLWQVRENYHYGMMKFSPNGKWLFMSGENLLDPATGRLLVRFTEKTYPLAFSPDSRLLVVMGKDDTLRLLETATGKFVGSLKGPEKAAFAGVFTADGRRFIGLSHDKRMYHWDVDDRKLLKSVDMPIPQWRTLQFSPDGRTLAVTPYSTEPVRLWDIDTGKERCRLQGEFSSANYGLAFSPDGRTLATDRGRENTMEGLISLWDTATGRLRHRFPIPRRSMGHLEFAVDGRTLVSTSSGARVRLWDSVTGKPLFERPSHDSDVHWVSFSPDSQTLVSASWDGTVRVWETATGRHLRELTPHTKGGYQAVVLPDGKRVISTGYDGRIVVQDLQTGKVLQSMVPDPEEGKSKNVSNTPVFAVSADGRSAVSYKRTEAGTTLFHVWDIATGRALQSRTSTLNAHQLVFSQDARTLASHVSVTIPSIGARGGADADKRKKRDEKQGIEGTSATQVQLQDAATGRQLLALTMPDRSAYRAAFAPDGRTVMTVTSRDLGERNQQAYTFRLWELASGKERWSLTNPETVYNWYVQEIAFVPDGRGFVAALGDNTIRLFDVASGKELLRRSGHEAPVRSLAFAPNGRSLASGHADGTILLWDLTLERPQHAPAAKPTDEQLQSWWTDLAAADAQKAHAAIWKLAACPQQALPLLSAWLRPVDPLPTEKLQSLLSELDSNDFARRREAAERLADLGEQAEPALRTALESNPSAEQKRRIEWLLSAPCIVKSPAKLRDLRAVETLEYIGSLAACKILKKLAVGDPFARLTKEAKASLDRLAKRAPVEP